MPGAGWVGLDPTSGLLAGEGHLPLAASPGYQSAAPITGAVSPCEVEFDHQMSVVRLVEDPRVTKPYSGEQWHQIDRLGQRVDADLESSAVRLTMGGEPTFVSLDDMEGAEWTSTADGPRKRRLAGDLVARLRNRFAPGGLLHFGQGKWYPGEQLPRWALACHWRKDGQPIWTDPDLVGDGRDDLHYDEPTSREFIQRLAEVLEVDQQYIAAGYEDAWHYLAKERRLPVNVDLADCKLDDPLERTRLARIFEAGLQKVVGYALPLQPRECGDRAQWTSGPWSFRQERMYLIPGDSPMGYRLPLASLPWSVPGDRQAVIERDPLEVRPPLADYTRWHSLPAPPTGNGHGHVRLLHVGSSPGESGAAVGVATLDEPAPRFAAESLPELAIGQSAAGIIRTALCVEAGAASCTCSCRR